MSVRFVIDEYRSRVALYDSVTGIAFGPVFPSEQDADDFLDHLKIIGERDPRVIPLEELCGLAREFMDERESA